jgi:2-oxoglutarate dehydrogenase complex dehydrogenase (E1) component-like enzyme
MLARHHDPNGSGSKHIAAGKAAPAVGMMKLHLQQQTQLVEDALE